MDVMIVQVNRFESELAKRVRIFLDQAGECRKESRECNTTSVLGHGNVSTVINPFATLLSVCTEE